MTRTAIKTIAIQCISALYILLFVYAALSKLLAFETFTLQLAQSPLLSAYAPFIAWTVPALEIGLSLLLLFSITRTIGFYAAFVLMVMFTVYIFIILHYSDFVPCSCGGVLEDLSWNEHLVFNIVFILLAAVAIALSSSHQLKKLLFHLSCLALTGVLVVVVLFQSSETKMHVNNAFQRRYLPHPIEKIGSYDLTYNSYYIAGMSDSSIYLGNYKAPLALSTFNIASKRFKDFSVSISNTDLPYRRVQISVEPPYVYVGDGTVPVLFRGTVHDWHATPLSYQEVYFSQFVAVDSTTLGIMTKSSETKTKAIGLLLSSSPTNELIIKTSLLKKEKNNSFETDGVLLWNEKHQQFIYSYYYRNSYEVMNEQLEHLYSGNTIDTIQKPILDVAYFKKKNQYTLGGKSITVNRISATSDDYLYINSDRLGRYENEKIITSASIIDVYHIKNKSYLFSFYIYHQPEAKLLEFQIYKDLLIAIVEDTLWIYKLKPKFFNSGSNTTHTAQYQE